MRPSRHWSPKRANWWHEGRSAEAVPRYQEAIAHAPASGQLWVELGEAYRSGLSMPLAIAAFRKALELEPAHEVAQLSLAECYRQMINFDEAKKIIDDAARHPS